jgi:hypothetical protein
LGDGCASPALRASRIRTTICHDRAHRKAPYWASPVG